MIKQIGILVATLVIVLWGFSALMDSALADVTDAGTTTNDQVNSSGSNTAITGGYHSEATTNYQAGSSSNTTSTATTNNTTNAYTGDSRVVPSASAPAISSMSQDLCTTGVSGGIQKFGLGASVGITKRDMNCERMKLSKLLYDFNMKVAAVSILCQDARVFQSMIQAGTPCPFQGKIGTDALAEWTKYDKQRPDYDEYVKALKYMERVDDKIIKQLEVKENPDEQVITNKHGDIIKLGNN